MNIKMVGGKKGSLNAFLNDKIVHLILTKQNLCLPPGSSSLIISVMITRRPSKLISPGGPRGPGGPCKK